MLVLTRRVEECVVLTLPDKSVVVIQVQQADYGVCKLGIQADKSIAVLRDDAKKGAP